MEYGELGRHKLLKTIEVSSGGATGGHEGPFAPQILSLPPSCPPLSWNIVHWKMHYEPKYTYPET